MESAGAALFPIIIEKRRFIPLTTEPVGTDALPAISMIVKGIKPHFTSAMQVDTVWKWARVPFLEPSLLGAPFFDSATTMGADAFIFLFDYLRYRTEVVPAFVTFLRDGTVPAWLTEIRRKREESLYGEFAPPNQEPRIVGGIDIPRHCTHLDAELAPAGRAFDTRSLYESGWSDRVCHSSQCPERLRCSFVDTRADATADPEQVLDLLQLAVAQSCLGPCQFLGRSIDALWYWNLLNDIGLPQDDPIRALLMLLARRGYIVGYQWVLGTDGLHGWLNPQETADLAERLFALPLPDYDQSFAAMAQFRQVMNVLEKYPSLPPFHSFAHCHPTASFAELSLSFVRTVCRLASREGKGVLWGNDIYPDL